MSQFWVFYHRRWVLTLTDFNIGVWESLDGEQHPRESSTEIPPRYHSWSRASLLFRAAKNCLLRVFPPFVVLLKSLEQLQRGFVDNSLPCKGKLSTRFAQDAGRTPHGLTSHTTGHSFSLLQMTWLLSIHRDLLMQSLRSVWTISSLYFTSISG